MRRGFAALVIIACPALALGQPPSAAAPGAFPALPPIGLSLPPIGLPLAPIGLPLSPMGPPAIESMPRHGSPPPSAAEHRHSRVGSRKGVRFPTTVVYFVPAYGYGVGWGYGQPAPEPAPPARLAPPTGHLRLDVQPEVAPQLYVDGDFVGTPDDFSSEIELEVGRHTIELRALGFDPLMFDVRIDAGRSITYRGTLKPAGDAATPDPGAHNPPDAAPQASPVPPSTFYLIPGCYLGNVPPHEVRLPATCDLSRLIVRKP